MSLTFLPAELTNKTEFPQYALLESALKANNAVVLSGEPGTAKTATIKPAFDELYVIYGDAMNPEDVHGVVVQNGDTMSRMPMSFVQRLNSAASAGKKAAIFIDEMNNMDEVGQRACMRIFNERIVGDTRLHPDVRIIGAMNPPDQAGGFDFNSALTNRFKVVHWKADVNRWIDYIIGLSNTHAKAAGYFASAKHKAQQFPATEAARQKKWASMRSWTMALADLHYLPQDKGLRIESLAGYVGEGAAIEYCQWEEKLDLIDPEILLKDPSKFKLEKRSDKNYAQLFAVVAAIQHNNTPDRWTNAVSVMTNAANQGGADVAVIAVNKLLQPDMRGKAAIPAGFTDAFNEVLKIIKSSK